jgi:hypothetical protein
MAPSVRESDGEEGVSTDLPSQRESCSTTASKARWACYQKTSLPTCSHGPKLQVGMPKMNTRKT